MNKSSLNKDDLEVQLLAHLLAGDVENVLFPQDLVDFGRQVLKEGSTTIHDATELIKQLGINESTIGEAIVRMLDGGVIKFIDDRRSRISFTEEMVELVLSYNPEAEVFINSKKEKKMDKGNKQDASNQGSIQKASDNQEQGKQGRSRFDEMVEKVNTPQNFDLAMALSGREANPMDEEANLVRAIYDENADGVTFDQISNNFDVRGERASLFMALSKDLSQRGVIDKIPGSNGDLYVVTMPFRKLMENAKAGGQKPAVSEQQERRDGNGANERRTGQAADQYRNDTGRELSQDLVEKREPVRGQSGQSPSQQGTTVDTPMSVRDRQREGGNDGSGSQGQRDTSGDDTGPGDDFKPDPAVLSLSLAVFGTPVTLEEVRAIVRGAEDVIRYAKRNPELKPSFEIHGITFGKERAEQFLQNAKFYGLGD